MRSPRPSKLAEGPRARGAWSRCGAVVSVEADVGQVLENGRPDVRPAGRGAKVSRCALARAQTAEGKLAKSDLGRARLIDQNRAYRVQLRHDFWT